MRYEYEIDLPFPVSTNRLWKSAHVAGRTRVYTSIEYSRWIKAADALYLTQKRRISAQVLGNFTFHIILDHKHRKPSKISHGRKIGGGDGDNRMKGPLDWCERVGLIHNDRDCDAWSGTWGDAPAGCRVILTGEPYGKINTY
jgi:Holliday junction resolvase RusA-like endonuclease